MCGRFSSFTFRDIKIRWNIQGDFFFQPRYNIAPSQSVPVIVRTQKGNEARLMNWGLVPSWASNPNAGHRMINARSETLRQKPAFRDLISRRRCVIPADGFYEWQSAGKQKNPFWIHLKSKEPFVFAGLWDSWGSTNRPALDTFTIITTEANALLRPIHDRMPVIYNTESGGQWLDLSFDSPTEAFRSWPAEEMEAWEVSTLVNAPENDSPACVQAVLTQVPNAQLSLL
jgi:putative SOS response-associated peptidase YedK